MTWIDDSVIVGPHDEIQEAKEGLKEFFECDDNGEMKQYIGMKIKIDREKHGCG
jgi:hypothetical protein